MSANSLEGPLPVLPTSLVSLDFSLNNVVGRLPDDMSAYVHLVDVQAFGNNLQGPLPAKLPPNLVQLAVAANGLSGQVPALPRGMRYLSVAQNHLQGKLPDGPGAAALWFVSTRLKQLVSTLSHCHDRKMHASWLVSLQGLPVVLHASTAALGLWRVPDVGQVPVLRRL